MTNFFKKVSIFSISAALVTIMLVPVIAFAQAGGSASPPSAPTTVQNESQAPSNSLVWVCTGGAPGECTFADVIQAIKKVLKWGTIFAIQFAVIVLAYAGFKYMISGDKPAERAAANEMLLKVVKGIVLILLAWAIVTMILNALNVTVPTYLN